MSDEKRTPRPTFEAAVLRRLEQEIEAVATYEEVARDLGVHRETLRRRLRGGDGGTRLTIVQACELMRALGHPDQALADIFTRAAVDSGPPLAGTSFGGGYILFAHVERAPGAKPAAAKGKEKT